MSSIAFDPPAFVKRLTQAGMDEQQTEALVECQAQLVNDSLATRLHMEEVKKRNRKTAPDHSPGIHNRRRHRYIYHAD